MDVEDHFFLAWIEEQASTGGKVRHGDVDRLRLLADWADTPAPPNWDGTLDQGETLRAVESARKRLLAPSGAAGTTDIVERLRHHAKVGDGWTRQDAAEAADKIEELKADTVRLRRAWLSVIQAENSCPATGGGCLAKRCGCQAEMEMLLNENQTTTQKEKNDD